MTKAAPVRDIIFAVTLAVAALMVAVGAGYYTVGAGLIVGGLLLAGLAWLVLGEVDK